MTRRARKSTGRGSSTRKSTRSTRRRRTSEPWLDLGATLRVEVLGIVIISIAILTFLSFISPNQGKVTAGWLHLLRQGFGWGAYLAPFVFGALGLGLLMHGFGRLAGVRWERVIGLSLIAATALGLTHLIVAGEEPWSLVVAGRGGGLLGWAVGEGLRYAIGDIGAYVMAVALFVIGLVLFLGRSTAEIGFAIWSGWDWLRGQWALWRSSRASRSAVGPSVGAGEARTVEVRRPTAVARSAVAAKSRSASQAQGTLPARVIGDRPQPATGSMSPLRDSIAPTVSRSPGGGWRLPDIGEIFEDLGAQEISQAEIQQRVQIIEQTLESFGVPARVVEVNQGPVVTQFGVEPGFITGRGGKQTKVKVSRISSLADDLALALAAAPIRIEAPVPGRSIVGIEVPNKEVALVSLREVMESKAFARLRRKTPLPIALGENVSGEPVVADLVAMPHLLIAGATGSGKSVCINSIISCFLCTNTPDRLKMVMIDPKRVELTGYNGIPHLLTPVIVDLERVVGALQWVTREMEQRYKKFAKVGARNIEDFNRRVVAGEQEHMPYIVVFIDELADLMMIAPEQVEKSVCRIAQMARATGIHLIIATQRPSVDVVTGLIKANFPARISFMVTSSVDSRVIIDTTGAERLLGSGDMLFMSPDASQPMRLQGCFVSDTELERLIGYWKGQATGPGERRRGGERGFEQPTLPTLTSPSGSLPGQGDEMIERAIEIVRREGRASTTLLQRRLRIGYARAARIIEVLEERGVVGPDLGGSKGRQVLVPRDES